MQDDNQNQKYHPFSILVLLILFSICSSLAYLKYFQNPSKSNPSCPVIITDYIPDQLVWIDEKDLLFVENKQLYRGSINSCDLSARSIETPTNFQNILLCEHSPQYIISTEEGFKILDTTTNTVKHSVSGDENFLIYCDTDYIVIRKGFPEYENSIDLYEIKTGIFNEINENSFPYSLVPIDSKTVLTFGGEEKTGLYYSNNLLITEDAFGYWDVSRDKKHLYFSAPIHNKLGVYSLNFKSKEKKLVTKLPFSVNNFIKISPNAKSLATTDLQGYLVIANLTK